MAGENEKKLESLCHNAKEEVVKVEEMIARSKDQERVRSKILNRISEYFVK